MYKLKPKTLVPILKQTKLSTRTSQRSLSSDIKTSFRLPSVEIDALPKLTNFGAAKEFFSNKVLEGNKELHRVWLAPDDVVQSFRTIFPEIVQSRGLTQLHENAFGLWDKEPNTISVELDDGSVKAEEKVEVLSVGGPAALAGAVLQKLRYPNSQVVYGVTHRHDSNHDGSAYYFHERDAFPVYINKVNRGPYCIYADIRKRVLPKKMLLNECINNRHHVKISLNWKHIRPSMMFGIFIPNFYHMTNDIYIKDPKKTLMRHTVEHAKKTHDIVSAVAAKTGLPKEAFLLQGHEKACYVGFEGASSTPDEHFTWLNSYTDIPFYKIDHTKAFGKDVNEVVTFPRDGLMSPWIIDNLKNILAKQSGGRVQENMQVTKILVKKSANNGIQVTKVVWKDTANNHTRVTEVDKFMFSLGPSASLKANPPNYSLVSHLVDIFRGTTRSTYQPTFSSFVRHVANKIKNPLFRGQQVFKNFMWAAGSSSVMMVVVDLEKASTAHLDLFTKFLDGVNQHWTIIAERDALCKENGKKYRCFAIQMTGGGNFPSRKVRPDYLVNLLHTTEKMMVNTYYFTLFT